MPLDAGRISIASTVLLGAALAAAAPAVDALPPRSSCMLELPEPLLPETPELPETPAPSWMLPVVVPLLSEVPELQLVPVP
ncbi:hypothetical protein ACFOHT_09395 [Massilia oculi]|uniref:hypothetical protein n=1 Tax=Massilia oculi TaxID=945844 RepID=UPI00360DF610